MSTDGTVAPYDAPAGGSSDSPLIGGSGGGGDAPAESGSGSDDGGAVAGEVAGNGGTSGTGGAEVDGGVGGGDGGSGTGGASGTGGSTTVVDCTFTVSRKEISSKMSTVGIVEWSTTLADLTSAQIVFTLDNAAPDILNRGGVAPVDLAKPSYRTLLLGLKQSSTYTFHIEAASGNSICKSSDFSLPKTGILSGVGAPKRTATNPSAQAGGFIITSGGLNDDGAYIIDADGAVVWRAASPILCSRAHMDYEGNNMWMLSLNVGNFAGEMRYVSMDGQTSRNSVSGLGDTHHDFTVLPGKIAALSWAGDGSDPESNLVEHASDGSGTTTTAFKIGANLYAGAPPSFPGGNSTYHANYVLYHPEDDTFTIADRNPHVIVKVKHDGTPVWQIGGSCADAKAPKCVSDTWKVNHGHDFDKGNGNIVIFNNREEPDLAHVLEFQITETSTSIATTLVKDFDSGFKSYTFGDVQRLPNGNTLMTFAEVGQILEVDSSWNTVQVLEAASKLYGYAEWRQTLYGPPDR